MKKGRLTLIWGHIKQGFLTGLGWSLGVTVGFAIVSTIIINVVRAGGGLPLIGNFFASIVEVTQGSLEIRS